MGIITRLLDGDSPQRRLCAGTRVSPPDLSRTRLGLSSRGGRVQYAKPVLIGHEPVGFDQMNLLRIPTVTRWEKMEIDFGQGAEASTKTNLVRTPRHRYLRALFTLAGFPGLIVQVCLQAEA